MKNPPTEGRGIFHLLSIKKPVEVFVLPRGGSAMHIGVHSAFPFTKVISFQGFLRTQAH
jgi:hypothetical protein